MKTTLCVKVLPNASVNEIVGFEGDALKIRIKAPPEKDKANVELIRFLAKKLKISRSDITLLKGRKSKLKLLEIENISYEKLLEKINLS